MDSPSPPSPSSDDSDEYLTPQRSPSRLDFCLDDGDPPTNAMDWFNTSISDDGPYTFVEHIFDVEIAPPASPRLLVAEAEDDPPQATDSHPHELTDPPPLFFASSDPEPMEGIPIEPQAPTPVRPPCVQMQAEVREVHGSSTLPRVMPQRLNYPHRGFSRSALLQQKALWNSRHEEWLAWQSGLGPDTDNAYTGLAHPHLRQPDAQSPPSYMHAPPSGLERDLEDKPPRRHEQDIHSSIFPRVGDLLALRDPYAANIDRSFHRLPLWTLHKALYAFDMQRWSAPPIPFAPAYDAGHVQASISSSTLSSYSSSGSGEDEESDSTLVADDSPVPKSQLLEPVTLASSPQSPWSWCGWELSWYARWQVLIGIFRGDYARCDASEYPVESAAPVEACEVPTAPSSAPTRIFRFTVRDEENDDSDDSDEEVDYGIPIISSSFSTDFEEEYERALAFYGELKSSEVGTW